MQEERFENSLAARMVLIVTAFVLMIMSSCFVMYYTLNQKLLRDAEMTMDDTQMLFSRILHEPEAVLNIITGNIRGIYNRGEGYYAIKRYITECTNDEFTTQVSMLQYYTIYAHFTLTGDFHDGSGWEPVPEYVPQERPWYKAAEAADGGVGMTSLYADVVTGRPIVSYSRQVFDDAGVQFATVAVDVFVDHLREMVVEKHITPNSYGFMIDENSTVIMHHNPEIEGELYGYSNPDLLAFSDTINAGEDISFESVSNYEGMNSVIFGRQLDNDWYFILLIPESEYYSELTSMIVISSILGAVLAGLLIIMHIRIERAKRKLDEENRLKVLQLAEAEGATQAKSAFLAQMSHEIRTPLNAILGITEITMMEDTLSAKARESLSKIYSSGDMLLGIINDILDLSKIEAGKLELIIEEYDFSSMFVDMVQLNAMRIGSKPIEFKMHVSEDVPVKLLGDQLRIKQILNNVLSNAFKYTEEGQVTLKVSVENNSQFTIHNSQLKDGDNSQLKDNSTLHTPHSTLEANDVYLVFEVSDTGQGMTPEQIAKLGEQYSRFNEQANRTTEGTGLGMNITRNLVHMMGGDISVESEPGKGSTFTVRILQAISGTATLGKQGAENLVLSRVSGDSGRMKRTQISREPMPYGSVLIVDDVETNIFVATGLMAPYGLKINSAESGQEAIELVKSGKTYDVIFMDHMMPGMDGVEATGIIRALGYKAPIIALTANAVSGQAEMFLASGFDDFISKPIDVRQLNNALNKWVRDKQPVEVLEAARATVNEKLKMENEKFGDEGSGEKSDDAEMGLYSGSELNPKLVQTFLRDAKKSVAVLDEVMAKGAANADNSYSDDDLRLYIINVHGLKAPLSIVGHDELSEKSRYLETVAREGNVEVITKETPPFLSALKIIIEELSQPEDAEGGDAGTEDSNPELLREKLGEIKAACEEYDESKAEEILRELDNETWSADTRALLSKLSEHLLHSDFDEIVNIIENVK